MRDAADDRLELRSGRGRDRPFRRTVHPRRRAAAPATVETTTSTAPGGKSAPTTAATAIPAATATARLLGPNHQLWKLLAH